MMLKAIDIQYFGEDISSSETGAGVNPDAGDNTVKIEEPSKDKSEEFEKLIQGEYKEEYGKRVSKIVKNRLKNLKENAHKNSEVQETEKSENGTENSSDTEGNIEGKADQPQKEKDSDEKTGIDTAEIEALGRQIAKAREVYPNFDLERELDNSLFRTLITIPGMEIRKAFEICHHDEIIAGAMEYAVLSAEKKLAQSTASGLSRPNEAVQNNTSCVVIDNDPRGLTKAQRADIKKRVRRGEKIVW